MDPRLLRELPSVDELLRCEELKGLRCSASVLTGSVREALDKMRGEIISGNRKEVSRSEVVSLAREIVERALASNIKKVINATGTILHTNIGRAILSKEAVAAVLLSAENNINLEFDLARGERGERDSLVEDLVKRLTGAEAACVVNNNAAAVLITLNTLAEGKDVVISRGELIEIGGSFRLPEIINKSGCVLKEVGTTNRTHPKDYSEAIGENTAILFKAHTSNYKVVGFTAEVDLKELASIGQKNGVPVIEDLGSGSLLDLSKYGLPREPMVRDSISSGADIVTFSGDKLLGGPQAGIIAGKKEFVARIKKNPLKRALRADKLTLAALEATLRLYLDEDNLSERLPALRFIARPLSDIEKTAREAKELLIKALRPDFSIDIEDGESVAGGGSLPGHNIPTKVLSISHGSSGPEEVSRIFLEASVPILGRIKKDRFILDMRTVEDPQDVIPVGLK